MRIAIDGCGICLLTMGCETCLLMVDDGCGMVIADL